MGKQQRIPEPDPNRKILYDYILTQDDVVQPKSFELFETAIQDPKIMQWFHKYLKGKGFGDVPDDPNAFYEGIWPTKDPKITPADIQQGQLADTQIPERPQSTEEERAQIANIPIKEDSVKRPENIKALLDNARVVGKEAHDRIVQQVHDKEADQFIAEGGSEVSGIGMFKAIVKKKKAELEKLLETGDFEKVQVGVSPTGGLPQYRQPEKRDIKAALRIYDKLSNLQDKSGTQVGDAIRGFFKNYYNLENIPFIGSIPEIEKNIRLMQAADAETRTRGQGALLSAIGMETLSQTDPNLKQSMGANVGRSIPEMFKYMGEFLATGPVYTAAKTAATKGVIKVIGDVAKNKAKRLLAENIGRMTGVLAQTFSNPQAIAQNVTERMAPPVKMVLSLDDSEMVPEIHQGESFGTAFAKGLGITVAEFLTERFGQYGGEALAPMLKNKQWVKKLTLAHWAQKRGFKTKSKLDDAFKKAGWNGVLAETWLEEYPNRILQTAITGDANIEDVLNPLDEEMQTTMWTMMVMRSGKMVRQGITAGKIVAGEIGDRTQSSYRFDGVNVTRQEAIALIEEGNTAGLNIENDQEVNDLMINLAAVEAGTTREKLAAYVSQKKAKPVIKKAPTKEVSTKIPAEKAKEKFEKSAPIKGIVADTWVRKNKSGESYRAAYVDKKSGDAFQVKKQDDGKYHVNHLKSGTEAPIELGAVATIEKAKDLVTNAIKSQPVKKVVSDSAKPPVKKVVRAKRQPIIPPVVEKKPIVKESPKKNLIDLSKKEQVRLRTPDGKKSITADREKKQIITMGTDKNGLVKTHVTNYKNQGEFDKAFARLAGTKGIVPTESTTTQVGKIVRKRASEAVPEATPEEITIVKNNIKEKHKGVLSKMKKNAPLRKAFQDYVREAKDPSTTAYAQTLRKARELAKEHGIKEDDWRAAGLYVQLLNSKDYASEIRIYARQVSGKGDVRKRIKTEGGDDLQQPKKAGTGTSDTSNKRTRKKPESDIKAEKDAIKDFDEQIENEKEFDEITEQYSTVPNEQWQDPKQKDGEKAQEEIVERPTYEYLKPGKNDVLLSIREIMVKIRQAAESRIGFSKRLGRSKGFLILGKYSPWFRTITQRRENDLSEVIHEAGHAKADKHQLVTKAPADVMKEIMPLASYGSKPRSRDNKADKDFYIKGEAVAEFIRGWMIGPNTMVRLYPKFTEYFENTLSKAEIKDLREIGDDIRKLLSSSAGAALLANTTLTEVEKKDYSNWKSLNNGFKITWWDRLSIQIVNSHSGHDKALDYVKKVRGLDLLPENDPYVLASLLLGEHSKLDNILRFGMLDFKLNRITDKKTKENMTAVWVYAQFDRSTPDTFELDKAETAKLMIAERTLELLNREEGDKKRATAVVTGLGAGFNTDRVQARRIMEEFDELKKENPDRHKRIYEAARRYRAYSDAIMQYAVSGGRMAQAIYKGKPEVGNKMATGYEYMGRGKWSKDGTTIHDMEQNHELTETWKKLEGELVGGYDYIKQHNEYYVALRRAQEEDVPESFDDFTKIIKGGRGKARAVVTKRGPGIERKLTYKVKGSSKTILDPYESLFENMYRFVGETDANNYRRSFVDVLLGDPRMMEDNRYNKVIQNLIEKVPNNETGDNIIRVHENGQKSSYRIKDPDVMVAFKKFPDNLDNYFAKVANYLKRVIQFTVTHSPQFAIRNLIRDVQSRYILGISTPWSDIARKLDKPGLDYTNAYEVTGGGQFGYYERNKSTFQQVENDIRAELMADIKSKRVYVIKANKFFGRSLNRFFAASERVNRVAEFKARYAEGRKKGMDEYNAQLWAASKSRELIDFAKGGVMIKNMNRYIPFLNAAFRGLYAAYRTAATEPTRVFGKRVPVNFMTRLAIINILPTILEQSLLLDDDDKQEYDQLSAFRKDFFVNLRMGKQWLLIPKPFELGLLGSLLSRSYRHSDGDKYAFDGFMGSVSRSMLPLVGEPYQIFGGLGTGVDLMYNMDKFRDKDIVPTFQQGLILSQRSYPGASETGKFLGENITKYLDKMGSEVVIDPRTVDHLIRGYTTYWGQTATTAIDMITGDKTAGDGLAVLTSIIKTTPVWSSRDVKRIMELFGKHSQTIKYRSEFLEYLKLYSILPEGEQKENLKHRIFDMATAIRNVLEPLY